MVVDGVEEERAVESVGSRSSDGKRALARLDPLGPFRRVSAANMSLNIRSSL